MRRKRGSSNHQGIRKKRKSSSKQTLARVAERKGQQEAKLERVLSEAEARTRASRIKTSSLIHHTEVSEDAHEINDVVLETNHHTTDVRANIIASKIEGHQNAYKRLVEGLQQPLFHTAEANELSDAGRTTNQAAVKKARLPNEEKTSGNGVNAPSGKPTIISSELPKQKLEEENRAAAIRENAHFHSDVKISSQNSVEGILQSLGNYPDIGRVTGVLEKDKKESLEHVLKEDCANVDVSCIGMQPTVCSKWLQSLLQSKKSKEKHGICLKSIHRAFLAVLREYYDTLICRKLSAADEDVMRRLYVAHCLSHILRCRGRVLRNDAAKENDDGDSDDFKDQGYTRARVLILLPFKNVAYEVVHMLRDLAVGVADSQKDVSHVANSERFELEFAPDEHEEDTIVGGEPGDESDDEFRTSAQKPREHLHMFRGNLSDDFKLGISFSRKTMRLYTDFYDSDIIIASPVGLTRSIAEKASGKSHQVSKRREKQEEDSEWKTGLNAQTRKPKNSESNEDFLSSIEICVVDGAHVFSMQNWSTLLETVAMCNKMPASTGDTDFSRVRDWCLDGLMHRFTQTVILASYRKSEFLSMFRERSNHAGKVHIVQRADEQGTMSKVMFPLRESFCRVKVPSPQDIPQRRFDYFFDVVFIQLRELRDSRTLIVIPSYFDFVRVRNRFVEEAENSPGLKFASMCEYSMGKDVDRVRSRLFAGQLSFVLMTERFHFFWRHWIRGANIVVWYGVPENSQFYPEIINMIPDTPHPHPLSMAITLFDQYDLFALERVVGRARAKKMMNGEEKTTMHRGAYV